MECPTDEGVKHVDLAGIVVAAAGWSVHTARTSAPGFFDIDPDKRPQSAAKIEFF